MSQNDAYAKAIQELSRRRQALIREADEIAEMIAKLNKLSGVLAMDGQLSSVGEQPRAGGFSRISLHWACLWILAESGSNGLTTSEITAKLLDGGRTSTAYSFTSTVSAVLSGMKLKSGEAEQNGNIWTLTAIGKQKWQAIEPRARSLAGNIL